MSKVSELREIVERQANPDKLVSLSLPFLRLLLEEIKTVEHIPHIEENLEKASQRAAAAEREVVQLKRLLAIAERAAGLTAMKSSEDGDKSDATSVSR